MEIKGRVGMDTPPGSTGRNKKEQEGTRRNKEPRMVKTGREAVTRERERWMLTSGIPHPVRDHLVRLIRWWFHPV
jgi:hypothetical protein